MAAAGAAAQNPVEQEVTSSVERLLFPVEKKFKLLSVKAVEAAKRKKLTEINENVVTNGGPSSFGKFLTAMNPNDCSSARASRLAGCAGGTGSGACCWPDNQPQNKCPENTYGGSGGTGGNGGGGNAIGNQGGAGQGSDSYSKCLRLAKLHSLTAGEGGKGGLSYSGYYGFAAGGSGGGVLIDGHEPQNPAGNG